MSKRSTMIRAALGLCIWTMLGALDAAAQITTAAGEDAAVRAAVEHYLQAHATGDGSHIRAVFHPRLNMMWVNGDTLALRTAEEFASGFRGQPQPDEAQRKRCIAAVDVSGTAAVAKVVLDYPNRTFVDYFALLKIDGEWKIVTKVFASEAK